ncbi:MAG: hypothetical protein UR56_C0003G0042 [Candidatus Roizmanbacteria bacterium GW2011_GWC2_34_23]|uniref:Uncharacterized protein n=1 Tax=Candidatus Roizmanbacteria bacterium GW2011_GWC2_34_23 TaxID=1618484 RepID=A0A0G0DIH1_9BACT|nr:MAG: hypothetical protein UR56_C0003G0042 [Candidatus Roizmanbacteria bacterium GW2011_GWC2_34_23]
MEILQTTGAVLLGVWGVGYLTSFLPTEHRRIALTMIDLTNNLKARQEIKTKNLLKKSEIKLRIGIMKFIRLGAYHMKTYKA